MSFDNVELSVETVDSLKTVDDPDNIAVHVSDISKSFQIYPTPRDRLKQSIMPRLQRLLGHEERRYYREFWALRDISFTIQKGETVGIIGKNGSGKSTLLQIICGTLTPTAGEVRTTGRVAALLELGSGFNPEFTGRENVYMNASVLGLSTKEIDSRFEAIVAFADIGDFIEQPVKTYSSGMAVRLAFAVAINVDADILIVDEALSVGDELFQRKCFGRIEAIRAAGATILFVSHSGGTIIELCDRAILIDAGEQLAIGSPKQMVGRYQKLLFAPILKRNEIREQIKRLGLSELVVSNDRVQLIDGDVTDVSAELVVKETFDPHLKSTSMIEYESHGAIIIEPGIFMLSGQQVNNIQRGVQYVYSYSVKFALAAHNVRFGMMIKTITGMELGGAASASSFGNGLPYVSAGSNYRVEFRFNCSLNPGTYFLNAGVVGEINGAETYLHRLIDVAIFRVMPVEDSLATGLIDFGCVPEVEHKEISTVI